MNDNVFREYAEEVKAALDRGHTIGVLPGTKFYIVEVSLKEGESQQWTPKKTFCFTNEESARKYVIKEIYLTLCRTMVRESLAPAECNEARSLIDPQRKEALTDPIIRELIEDFHLRGGSELRNRFLYESFDDTMGWVQSQEVVNCYTFGQWRYYIRVDWVEREFPQFLYCNSTLYHASSAVQGIDEIIEDKIKRAHSLEINLESKEAVIVAQVLGCELEAVPGSSIFQVNSELYQMPFWAALSDSFRISADRFGPYFSTRVVADSRAILDSIDRLIINECITPWGVTFPLADTEEEMSEDDLIREMEAIEEGTLNGKSYLEVRRETWAHEMKEWVKSHNYFELKPFIIESPRMSEKIYSIRSIIEHRILEDVILNENSLKDIEEIAHSEISSGDICVDDNSLLVAYTFISMLAFG